MAGHLATRPEQEADYESIELAVMETARGRWFLAEYARRNRQADTQVLLSALSRIEKSIAIHREPGEMDKFRLDILEMSRAISRTRAEIAAIKPADRAEGRILEASGELDSIVGTTEGATSEILAAAEQVQELAWTMREAGGDVGLCDALDQRATEIYTACSFQDLTSQRIRKVIEALGFLEQRVNAMVEIWDFGDDASVEPPLDPNDGLARDPSMSQADVDFVLVEQPYTNADEDEDPEPFLELEMNGATVPGEARDLQVDFDDVMMVEEASGEGDAADPLLVTSGTDGGDVSFSAPETMQRDIAAFSAADEAPLEEPSSEAGPVLSRFAQNRLQLVHSTSEIDSALTKVRKGAELSPEEAAQALDALQRMSVEERTRLFS
jgi:chemotaxis regulatin CheY-phosphate phosphatase CheZ